MMNLKQFGGKPTADLIQQYALSPNWKNDSFQNQEETKATPGFFEIPEIMYKMIKGIKDKEPSEALPVQPLDKEAFLDDSQGPNFIWYGHAALMMRVSGKTILIDPMLGPDCSPIGPVRTRRFSKNTLDLIDDFPEIDLILITHDHYDHLDLASIEKLRGKTAQFFVALGVKRHLEAWGVDCAIIREFDWWDSADFQGIGITFTPTRHFSGRGLRDRAKSLWGGWVLDTGEKRIWFSGDGGYGSHFKTIGEKLGPFDFGFMECGQYGEYWPLIHMFPKESVQAALDAGVKKAMPVHWGGFVLSFQHSWYEPALIFCETAKEKGLAYMTPQLGEVFSMNDERDEGWILQNKN
ncbi:MAG: MBL fold metallo-hydrolase [Bacteroidia bacterium]